MHSHVLMFKKYQTPSNNFKKIMKDILINLRKKNKMKDEFSEEPAFPWNTIVFPHTAATWVKQDDEKDKKKIKDEKNPPSFSYPFVNSNLARLARVTQLALRVTPRFAVSSDRCSRRGRNCPKRSILCLEATLYWRSTTSKLNTRKKIHIKYIYKALIN